MDKLRCLPAVKFSNLYPMRNQFHAYSACICVNLNGFFDINKVGQGVRSHFCNRAMFIKSVCDASHHNPGYGLSLGLNKVW